MKKLAASLIVAGAFFPGVFGQSTIPSAANGSISGIVMDDPYPARMASRPISGVKVGLWTPITMILADQEPTIPAIRTSQPITNWWLADTTQTDNYGLFSVKPPFAGKYILTFEHPDFNGRHVDMPVETAGIDTTIQVLMVPAGAKARIMGTVWSSCTGVLGMPCVVQPIPGCTVSVVKNSAPAFTDASVSPLFSSRVFLAVTDAQGQYVLDSVPVSYNGERALVSADKFGYISQSADTGIRRMETITVDYTLARLASVPGDTVFVTPGNPTAGDSLVFQLVINAHCCATKFRDKSVSVSGSNIFLSFSFDDTLCPYVKCITGFSQTEFTSRPVAAGHYDIYMLQSYYCPPGRACPMIAYVPEFVGSLTVTPGGSSVRTQPSALKAAKTLDISGRNVLVTLPSPANRVVLRAYDVSGKLLAGLHDGPLAAGYHRFDMAPGAHGIKMCIISLTADGKTTYLKTAAFGR
jgi:hypothetical protein